MTKRTLQPGDTFTHLTVLSVFIAKGRTWARCKCTCGETKDVLGFQLKNGRTKSCGHAKRISHLRDWYVSEKDLMNRTAAHQHWYTTYRPNGGESGQSVETNGEARG